MANPKRKISRSKRDKRRANWLSALGAPSTMECPNCGETKLRHHACPSCGFFNGRIIGDTEE